MSKREKVRLPLARLSQLDTLYAQLPRLECKRLCQDCCGPVPMSRLEWARIVQRLGHAPQGDESLVCPMLVRGSCRVYTIRPIMCRLWGLVQAMACPFGCVPERWLTDKEASRFIRRALTLGR